MEEIIWCPNCNKHTTHIFDEDDGMWYCTECDNDESEIEENNEVEFYL